MRPQTSLAAPAAPLSFTNRNRAPFALLVVFLIIKRGFSSDEDCRSNSEPSNVKLDSTVA